MAQKSNSVPMVLLFHFLVLSNGRDSVRQSGAGIVWTDRI
jgi:hypothetical protein